MATVSVLNMEGKEVEKLELNDNIFGVEINEHLVHLAVVSQLANNRQGTQKAKTRSRWWKKTLETERNRSCKTGIYPSSTVERRRSCICSNTKRVHKEIKQKRKTYCFKICINI